MRAVCRVSDDWLIHSFILHWRPMLIWGWWHMSQVGAPLFWHASSFTLDCWFFWVCILLLVVLLLVVMSKEYGVCDTTIEVILPASGSCSTHNSSYVILSPFQWKLVNDFFCCSLCVMIVFCLTPHYYINNNIIIMQKLMSLLSTVRREKNFWWINH